jgi:hypothetical protein
MHYHVVPVDIESVRVQLCNELNRSVTDLDVFAWLRRCGCVENNGRWVVHTPPLSPLRMINSRRIVPASA